MTFEPITDAERQRTYKRMVESENERRRSRVLRRAEEMARETVGKTATVRTAKASRTSSGSTVTGKIVSCEARVAQRGRSLIAQWTVVLQRPDNTTTEPLVIEELPR